MATSLTILANVTSSEANEPERTLPVHLAVNLEEANPPFIGATPAPVTASEVIPGTVTDVPAIGAAGMQGSATSQVCDVVPSDTDKENDKASLTPAGLSKLQFTELADMHSSPSAQYFKAVHDLSTSLSRYNAAVIQLSREDAVLVRCALASARLYFRKQAGVGSVSGDGTKNGGHLAGPGKSTYIYQAGRPPTFEEQETPPCLPQMFDTFTKVARVALSAVARHLRLRSEAFSALLDDCPLPPGELSSSLLTARCHTPPVSHDQKHAPTETEPGLLLLTTADAPGLEVRGSDGKWYGCDQGVGSGDLVLLVGRALTQVTGGHRQTSAYRRPHQSTPKRSSLCSLAYRLLPRAEATLECSAMRVAGHPVAERFSEPIPVPRFLEPKSGAEREKRVEESKEMIAAKAADMVKAHLSDPYTSSSLEDAVLASCGHSFGGGGLKRLIETMVCPACDASVDVTALVPNLTLRAYAAAYRRAEAAAVEARGVKRRRDSGAGRGREGKKKSWSHKGSNKVAGSGGPQEEQPGSPPEAEGSPRQRGAQFPYAVNDYVLIKGNKRTPEKFVGREAIITNQCLNGWYLVRTLDSGESVRLQYRSLQKADGAPTPLSLLHPSASAAGNPHPDSPPQATDLEDSSPRSRLLFPTQTSPPSSSLPTNDSHPPYVEGGMGSDAEARGGRGGSGEGPSPSRRESGGAEVFSKGGRMKGYVGGGAWEETHPGSDLSLKTKPRSPARVGGKGGREWWGEKEERSEKKRKKGGRLEEALCEGREEVPRGPLSLKLGRSSLGTSLTLEGGLGGGEAEAGRDGKEEETGWEWDSGKGLSRGWRGGKEVRWEDERGAHAGQEWQSKGWTNHGGGGDATPSVSVPPKKRDFGGGGFNAEGGKGGAYPIRTFLSNKSFSGSGSSPGREAMSPPRDRPPPPPLLSAGKEDSKAGAEVGDGRGGAGEGVAGVNGER